MSTTQTTPNVNQQTIPMFSPDGTLGDIPVAQINQARAAGAKPAVQVKSPNGDTGWIPADKLKDATAAGGKIVPIENQETQHPGFWNSVIEDVKGAVKGAATVGAAAFGDPEAREEFTEGLVDQIANAPKQYQQEKQAGYSLPYRAIAPVAQAAGVNVPGMEESARQGDVAGVAGHTVVPAATAVAPLGVEGAVRGAGAVSDAAKAALASETAQKVSASAKVLGASAEELPVVGKFVTAGKKLGQLRDIWATNDATKENVPFAGESEPPVTATPAPEDFTEPGTSAQTEGATENTEQQPPQAAPAPKLDTSPAAIQAKLNDALGGKPLQPNVPLRAQIPAKTTPTPASSLPEGFTPVESSAIKGYKYDPDAQELTTISNTGQQYTHAEVTPDEFKTFQDADSKGKAWNTIRQNHVLTQKNGRPVVPGGPRTVVTDPETGAPEFSDVVAHRQNTSAAPAKSAPAAQAAPTNATANDEDLTNLLQQSLKVKSNQQTTRTNLGQLDAQNGKAFVVPPGGVSTTAAPADLAKRWGVDENSIADTDRNLRGMNEQQSEAYINQLADAYKKGRPVEPVMETRDANNNIISVDGRHRALAAQRAGITRIPVIVRRIGSAQ